MKNINLLYKVNEITCETQRYSNFHDPHDYSKEDIPFEERLLLLEIGCKYSRKSCLPVISSKTILKFSVQRAEEYGIPFDGTPESVKKVKKILEGKVFKGMMDLEQIILKK
jgi:hypothetical protein